MEVFNDFLGKYMRNRKTDMFVKKNTMSDLVVLISSQDLMNINL